MAAADARTYAQILLLLVCLLQNHRQQKRAAEQPAGGQQKRTAAQPAATADLASQWAQLVTTAGTAVKRAPGNVARYASGPAVRLQLEALGPEAAAEIVHGGKEAATRALVEVALNCPILRPKTDEIQHTLARAALSAVKQWCQ